MRTHRIGFRVSLAAVLAIGFIGRPANGAEYRTAIEGLKRVISDELDQGGITGVAIALVDERGPVFASGFGLADKKKRRPVSSDTVFRCGSISKLFTAVAAMQLQERGMLDIDAPIQKAFPSFQIADPFGGDRPITLRQLMCHRSGLVREAPVGSYFDDSEPGTRRTVESLADCVLVYPPNTKTKYSNSGVSVVGLAIEESSGISFEEYQARHLLAPLQMSSSAFRLDRGLKRRLAKGYLPVADGKGGFSEIEAPVFEFGILPAGNLYTTVEDLAQFMSCLFAQGAAAGKSLIAPDTLNQMFAVQLTGNDRGFGLGFSMGEFQGHRTFGHSGAVYGFTSIFRGLIDHKIGVIALINDDIAIGPMNRLSEAALSLMLEAKTGERTIAESELSPVEVGDLASFVGDYESESYWAEIRHSDNWVANISGQRLTLTPVGEDEFRGNGRYGHDVRIEIIRDDHRSVVGFNAFGQTFRRVDPEFTKTNPIPEAWNKFLGSYGPSFIPAIVSVKHGHLYVMTENMFDYRLTPLNRTVFKMPPGLYADEHLIFQEDKRGRVHGMVLANMPLKRRR